MSNKLKKASSLGDKLAQKTRDKIKAKNKEARELYGLDDVPEATIQKNIATREAARKSMQKKVKSKKPLVVAGTAAAGLTGLIAESGRRRKEEAKKKEDAKRKDPVKKSKGGIVKAAKKVAKKAFPDLNKDGKVTQKDILIGKGVLKKKTAATKKAKSEGNPMRDMVNESASAKAADKARRKSNRRQALEAIGGATAMGVAGTIAYKADKAAEAADKEKQANKKPVKKANGGMLNSPAAVKRRSGAAVKGFKKGGMATKWESKWG